MTRQEVINEVLMHTEDELMAKYTKEGLHDMLYVTTGNIENRSMREYVFLLQQYANSKYTSYGEFHRKYAVHTKETDIFRALYTLKQCNYDIDLRYPNGLIATAYYQLIPNGEAISDNDKLMEMIEFLKKNDAPIIYDEE